MKILALSTSPRVGGNTDLLTDEFLRGACDHGCQVDKIHTARLSIAPCTQCDACYQHNQCTLQDDMTRLYQKILETDCLLFASPIYFMAHAAQAKLIIDRCQFFWARRQIAKIKLIPKNRPKRRGIFIAVGAVKNENIFNGAKVTMRWFFNSIEMEYWKNLLVCGVDEKAAIKNHPTAMQQAYELGQKLADLPS